MKDHATTHGMGPHTLGQAVNSAPTAAAPGPASPKQLTAKCKANRLLPLALGSYR